MTEYADLVRFRNDGDEFHVLWTARRALRILDASSGLVAVTVEGVSEKEGPAGKGVTTSVLVVDTTEYFGSENIRKADRVIYNQLKYSPTAPAKPWTVSGLKDTLGGFGDRYSALCEKYGQAVVARKIRFRFLTNRPISSAILQAALAAAANTPKIIGGRGLLPTSTRTEAQSSLSPSRGSVRFVRYPAGDCRLGVEVRRKESKVKPARYIQTLLRRISRSVMCGTGKVATI